MDPSNTIQLIVIITLVVLSAFFSSAETAFMSVNRIRIRTLVDEGNKRAAIVSDILEHSSKMLSAILIGNNIVNISASALTTTFVIDMWGNTATGIATGILTLVVLIFGEITPKTAATLYAERFTLIYAVVIRAIMFLFTPFIIIIDVLSKITMKLLHIDSRKGKDTMTENELRTIVEVGHENGVIETEEKQMINNVFDFGDSLAKDIMIPRIDMTMADVNSSYNDILELFKSDKYTRYPIYEDSTDNVIGILNVKDLLLCESKEAFHVRDIMREPYFTYEFKNTSKLLQELKNTSNNIAIVLDEYGATVGIITLEDLLEEIVGEIRDEYDEDEHDAIQQISDFEYRLDGSAKLDDINDLIGSSLESDEYDSIGGFIIEMLDRFPGNGDILDLPEIQFTVEATTNKRIDTVLMTLKQIPEE